MMMRLQNQFLQRLSVRVPPLNVDEDTLAMSIKPGR